MVLHHKEYMISPSFDIEKKEDLLSVLKILKQQKVYILAN
jgi:hypothetical protein